MFASKDDSEQKIDTASMPTTEPAPQTPTDPNAHLQQFLADNDYELSVGALAERTPFLDNKGFIMTDKPLLVISAKKKD